MSEEKVGYKVIGKISKSKVLTVSVQKFKKNGIDYINIREFIEFGNNAMPTRKGFVINAGLIDSLIALLNKAKE